MSALAPRELVAYNREVAELRATVAQLDTVDEAKDLADRAAAAQTWARRARLGQDAVNRAAEVKLRAERRAGELLGSFVTRGYKSETNLPPDVTRNQSSEWQALAAIPDADFDDAVAAEKAEGPLTRNGVMRRAMDVHYSSASDLWSTPQDLFDELNEEFQFKLDVCATPENAKCKRFFTEAQDGLAQVWRGACFMNPPYGDAIAVWVKKAHESSYRIGTTVVCLVPARVDTGWWWDHCRHGEIRFLRGRLRFGGGENAAPFPSAVVIFPRDPRVIWWERP